MIKIISTTDAPAAIGPYSQAVRTGNFLFLSGQIPINPRTNEIVEGDIVAQTRQVLMNIQSILESEKLSFENVVKTTIFIKDMKHFPMINEIYGQFFGNHKPARSTVEVSGLPRDVLIEIEAIAVKE